MDDSAIREQISREVKRVLSGHGLTAHGAAKQLELRPKTIYRWISKETRPEWDSLRRFAEKFGPINIRIGNEEAAAPPSLEERLSSLVDAPRARGGHRGRRRNHVAGVDGAARDDRRLVRDQPSGVRAAGGGAEAGPGRCVSGSTG